MTKRWRWAIVTVFSVLPLLLLVSIRPGFVANFTKASGCFENMTITIDGNSGNQKISCYYSRAEDENGIFYIFLPSYANLSELRIDFSGADEVKFHQENSNPAGDFSVNAGTWLWGDWLKADIVYEADFIKNGQAVENGKIKLMKSENLPAMFVETRSCSLDYLNESKDNREPGEMSLYTETGELEWSDGLVHMTGRGNETWKFDKRSYSIKLENQANLLGMGQAKDWILLCNVFDDAYIRNKITYDMAIAAGMVASPESRYMDLYVNGKYHGLYQLTEKVEIDKERIDIADLNKKNEAVNRANYAVEKLEPAYTDRSKAVYLPGIPDDITGGYLIERDYGGKWAETVSGFQTRTLHDCYSIINPKLASVEELQYISDLFENMEASIAAEDGINPDTGKSYLDYIDLKSFADKYIVEELSKNEGGGMSSAFYYKPEDSVSKKVFAGPVWDYDKAYARDVYINNNPRNLCYLTMKAASTQLYWHLYKHPEFREKVRTEYKAFFSDYLEELVNGKIDEYAEEIGKSAEMDQIRWKETYEKREAIHPDYIVNIESIREFLQERKRFLDEVWLKDAEICNIEFIDEYQQSTNRIGVIKGESLGEIPASESSTAIFEGWFHRDTSRELDISEPVLEDAVYVAKWKLDEEKGEQT